MTHLRNYANGRGFTLVEVVVTLFIIGIGALGVAGLQLAAMRSNQSAFMRSQVTLAAYALVDRMRADPGAFANAKLDTSGELEEATEGAKASFAAWQKELGASSLEAPDGQSLGELDCTTANACNTGHCRIVIRWDDSRGEDSALAPEGRSADALTFELCARMPL